MYSRFSQSESNTGDFAGGFGLIIHMLCQTNISVVQMTVLAMLECGTMLYSFIGCLLLRSDTR